MAGVIITAVRWVPRGCAASRPQTSRLSPEELKSLAKSIKIKGKSADAKREAGASIDDDGDNDIEMEMEGSVAPPPKDPSDPFDLANYNDDEDDVDEMNRPEDFPGRNLFTVLDRDLEAAAIDGAQFAQASSDEEANVIRPTDCLLLSVTAKPDVSTLEVCIYDDDNGAFYVHHDVMLGDMPACAEWIDTSPHHPGKGNLCAVGFMNSMIELWDMDVQDALEPVAVLGSEPKDALSMHRRRKAAVAPQTKDGHGDGVMDIHRNPVKSQLLGSGSADKTVRVWDLSLAATLHTYSHHTAEVQNVRWHPIEEPILVTASYDQSLALLDVRQPDTSLRASLAGNNRLPVSVTWYRHNPTTVLASCSSGRVAAFDLRKFSSSLGGMEVSESLLWDMQAHKQDCSVADSGVPNLMVTCSEDKTAKIWNMGQLTSDGHPTLEFERDLKGGPLLALQSNFDIPHLFAFAGSEIVIWDLTDTAHLVETFALKETN